MRREHAERGHALSFGGVWVERDDLEAVGRGGAAGAARRVAQDDLAVRAWPHAPGGCLLYTSPSPRDKRQSRMPSSA